MYAIMMLNATIAAWFGVKRSRIEQNEDESSNPNQKNLRSCIRDENFEQKSVLNEIFAKSLGVMGNSTSQQS